MSLLNKKLLRDIRVHKAQMIAVLVIVILGTIIFTVLLLVPRSLDNWLSRVFEQTSYESFKVEVAGAPREAAARLATLRDITAVQGTIEREVSASVRGADLTLKVVSVPDKGRASVNDLIVESGTYLEGGRSGACLAESHLAKAFELAPGDTVTLIINGRSTPVSLAGSAASPRFLRLVANQSTFLSDPRQFGVVFMGESDVARLFGTTEYNVFAARVSGKGTEAEAMNAAAAALKPYGVLGANTGAEEQSTRLLNMDIKNLKNVSVFFVLVFLWVSSLAIYITIARVIYTERRQIGTARALGYSEKKIVGHFLAYGLVIGLVGGLLGVAGGQLVGGAFIKTYANTLGLPQVQGAGTAWELLGAGLLLAVVLSVLGAAMPAFRSAKIAPAAAMRVDAGVTLREPSAKSANRSERRKRLPTWLRFPLRNLSRNRKRTALTFLGLVLTVATMVTVSGAIGSIDSMLQKQFKKITKWDVAAFMPKPLGPGFLAEVGRIKGVSRVEPAISSPARLKASGGTIDVSLQAYLSDTHMHGLFPAGGSAGPPRGSGMLVNRSVLRQVPLKVGETVSLQTALGTTRFKVDGFVKEPLGVGCYVDLGYVQKLIGSGSFNLVLVQCTPGATDRISRTLRQMPGVNKVETRRTTVRTMDETINKAIRPIFNVVLVMVLIIGFAIIFTLTSITMLERRQEIATVLTLGRGPLSVASSFLVETLSIGVLVVPVGIALGWVLCWVLMNKVLSTSTTQLAPEMSFAYLPVIGLSAAFLAVMALSIIPAARQLSKVDLATAARERAG
ncbi:MAG: ABC transporter permease [Candidatus Geothermincolia bacterium]